MTSNELNEQLIQMQDDIWADIERLSELRSNYNCFDEKEEPYYRALSNAIQALRDKMNEIITCYAERQRLMNKR